MSFARASIIIPIILFCFPLVPLQLTAQDFFDPHQVIEEYGAPTGQNAEPETQAEQQTYSFSVRITLSSGTTVSGVAEFSFQAITIYDISGKVVLSNTQALNTQSLSLGNLDSGFYTVVAEKDDTLFSQKLIIEK